MTVRFPAAVALAILLGGSFSCAAIASTAIVETQTVVSTLEEIGFFGIWAIRCGESAGLDNIVRSAFVSAAGEPGFSEDLGADLPENAYRILAAQRDGENQIVLDIELNVQMKQRLVMVVDNDRIRTLSNTLPDNRELVRNGVVVASGTRTPWLSRCDPAEQQRRQ
jgi:hypothetical protein